MAIITAFAASLAGGAITATASADDVAGILTSITVTNNLSNRVTFRGVSSTGVSGSIKFSPGTATQSLTAFAITWPPTGQAQAGMADWDV